MTQSHARISRKNLPVPLKLEKKKKKKKNYIYIYTYIYTHIYTYTHYIAKSFGSPPSNEQVWLL